MFLLDTRSYTRLLFSDKNHERITTKIFISTYKIIVKMRQYHFIFEHIDTLQKFRPRVLFFDQRHHNVKIKIYID